MALNPWPLGRRSAQPPKRRWWWFVIRNLPTVALSLLLTGFAAFVLWPYVVVNIGGGEIGVLWRRFGCGTVMDPSKLQGQGIHLIPPWDVVYIYNLRLQSTTETYQAISSDGVSLHAKVNIRFSLDPDFIPLIHEAFGEDYINIAIKPEIGSRAREVISRHTAEEVYTLRSTIEGEIKSLTETKMHEMLSGMHRPVSPRPKLFRQCEQKITDDNRRDLARSVHLATTLVLDIELPPPVVAAINRKIEQLYIAQEYVFRVERERRESERKQIEAVGIRNFQQTVSQGISDSYLRWRGIEATLQLAQSNNAKIVIIGNGRDGTPIILGNVDTPSTPSPATMPADQTAKPIAASPAKPAEKTRASGLSTPSERTPSSGIPASPSGGVQEPKTALPPGLGVLKSLFERATSSNKPDATAAEGRPAENKSPDARPPGPPN